MQTLDTPDTHDLQAASPNTRSWKTFAELIAGSWLWQVRSMDEAIEWIKRSPFGDGAEIEIRQVFEAADFGAEFTPELREAEERLRAEVAAKQKP